MPEPNSVDGEKREIEFINLDDDTDTGDSEFELPEGNGAQDDDSIAADEDVADEEEVNGLMRESEMSLSELLASYGLPASAIPDGTMGASVVGNVQSGSERPTLRKRRYTAIGNTSSEARVEGNRGGHQADDAVTAGKVIRNEAEVEGANTSAIEIDLTSSNGNADEEDEEAEEDDHADDADNDDDEVGSDEADGGEDDDMKSRAVSLWCQALAAGDSPPAYNSEEDEDYLPNVEGEGDWRGEMHVGEDYQATVPPSIQPINARQDSHLGIEALMLWQPGHLPEADVERYQQTYSRTLSLAAPISRIPDDEEALFLLLRANFDTDEALQRLQMKPVQPTEIPPHLETWSETDCTAFEKGFIAFNKNFLQIQENKLRHKTVGELVHFYYLWKKTARHDEFIRLYRREKKKPLHPGITDFMDCLMKEQLSSAVPSDFVHSDRTAGGPSGLEAGSQDTNQSTASVPKPQLASTLDVATPSTVPSSTSQPACVPLRELEDDPDVLVSPHLRTITQSIAVPVSSSTSSGHVEA